MNEKTGKNVRLYYGIALSVMTAVVGLLFIWQVLDKFVPEWTAGKANHIFTQADLASRFGRISPAFWIWIVMIIGGFAVWEIFPVNAKLTPYKDSRYVLARYKKRIPANVSEEKQDSFNAVKREEKIIAFLWLGCAVVGLAGIIYSIVYLAIPSHFTGGANVNKEVLNTAVNIFPWALAVFAVACGITVYEYISAKKQLEHAKKLSAGNKPVETAHGKIYEFVHQKYFILGVRIAVGCVAFAFFIAGICNGNIYNIMQKAVKICSECIGLG